MNTVEQRIELARAWVALEVPFLHLGRNALGADCVGLLVYALEYPEGRIPAYPRDPYQGKLEAELTAALGEPVARGGADGVGAATLLPGDVVAMAYGRPVRHVGFIAEHPAYPGHLSLIHTDSSVGKVTEHILDERWLSRIKLVYRP